MHTVHSFRYQIPDDWPYKEARKLFIEPLVLTEEEELDLKWSSPDEEVGIHINITFLDMLILRMNKSFYIRIVFLVHMKITRLHYAAFLTGFNFISGE